MVIPDTSEILVDFPLKKGESEGGRVLVGISLTLLLWPVKLLKLKACRMFDIEIQNFRDEEP